MPAKAVDHFTIIRPALFLWVEMGPGAGTKIFRKMCKTNMKGGENIK